MRPVAEQGQTGFPVHHGVAAGVFDLLHIGHVRYLQYARARCKRLTVLVLCDAAVLDRKDRLPVIHEADRLEMVRALACVDAALLIPQSLEYAEPSVELIRSLMPDCFFVGGDWRDTARWARLTPPLHAMGVCIEFAPRMSEQSTSQLRERMSSAAASPCSGRPR